MGLIYKPSYRSFITNYLLAGLVVIFLVMLYSQFNLSFSFTPGSINELLSSLLILALIAIIIFLVEEPTIKRVLYNYSITKDEIIEMTGIIRKKRFAIPLQSIADIRMEKGVTGRIFNFGNVKVTGFKDSIVMFGLEKPEEVYRIIKNKVSRISRTYGVKKVKE